MEKAVPMNRLNRDMLIEILARADGPAIVSASCASTGLREASQEKNLWENLCQTTWPSTKEHRVHDIISSSGGFAKFYSNSLPLVLYNPEQQQQQQQQQQQGFISTPSELVSLVDVFYGGVCVFSNVVHGIPMHNTGSWFLDCPFRLDALDDGASPPLMAEGEEAVKEVYKRLDELRLSWVLLDSRNGVAVNLSSWRPTLVEKNWPSEGNLLVRFSCPLPIDQQLLGGAGGVEYVIDLRFRVLERPMAMTELRMVEVMLQVEDVDGMHVNGRGSLMVLYWALSCSTRSRDRRAIEEGYIKYQSKQKEALDVKNRKERLVDKMCALSGAALFTFFCLSGYNFLM
ncbi:probable F-box protein At2g36090 [Dioscorea cayenensis subsp. rotundata]|uniref:Probable F-box protein At2g36090 n=1 Tax=Dioscorea cayennensis subsp. rotundata TaxID=55577 RepID=A0AB40CHB9_DIOCR|nr:probable F-box protein At2g36090 [Dioscorea cayenensis subsp. rotundata]